MLMVSWEISFVFLHLGLFGVTDDLKPLTRKSLSITHPHRVLLLGSALRGVGVCSVASSLSHLSPPCLIIESQMSRPKLRIYSRSGGRSTIRFPLNLNFFSSCCKKDFVFVTSSSLHLFQSTTRRISSSGSLLRFGRWRHRSSLKASKSTVKL